MGQRRTPSLLLFTVILSLWTGHAVSAGSITDLGHALDLASSAQLLGSENQPHLEPAGSASDAKPPLAMANEPNLSAFSSVRNMETVASQAEGVGVGQYDSALKIAPAAGHSEVQATVFRSRQAGMTWQDLTSASLNSAVDPSPIPEEAWVLGSTLIGLGLLERKVRRS